MRFSSLLSIAILIHFWVILILYQLLANSLNERDIISACAGSSHSCFVFGDKRVKCAGMKYAFGLSTSFTDYLGDEANEIEDNLSYINVSDVPAVVDTKCGTYFVCFQLDSKDIKCLGSSPIGSVSGNTGDSLPKINLGPSVKVSSMALGYNHACVLTTKSKVKCFGSSFHGQLGYGDTSVRGDSASDMGDNLPYLYFGTDFLVASIHTSSSANHNCVIFSSPTESAQRIKCWGENGGYQLGYGNNQHRGDDLYEMGYNLPLVDLGAESKVKNLALGLYHTCALLLNNAFKCFGYGYYGQLASGSASTISQTGDSMPSVSIDSGETIKFLSAGMYHTCIVYNDQVTTKCFGWNSNGQLGQGDTSNRGDTQETTIPNIHAIQFGTGSLNITLIVSGRSHNCVVLLDSSVRCFGNNEFGQLIIGSATNIGDAAGEMGNNLSSSKLFSPTESPSMSPTKKASSLTSESPTRSPTFSPSHSQTPNPTFHPSTNPIEKPTTNPSKIPTIRPSNEPTTKPTHSPTAKPISLLTAKPTSNPLTNSTNEPVVSPINVPSHAPLFSPTLSPMNISTSKPSTVPTASPVLASSPTFIVSSEPTASPSLQITSNPKYPTPPTEATNTSESATSQTNQIALGVSISIVGLLATFAAVMVFRYRSRIKAYKPVEGSPSQPNAAIIVGNAMFFVSRHPKTQGILSS